MPDPAPITIIPLGTVELAEVEAAAKRAAKALGVAIEVGKAVTLPAGHFDAARSQSHARKVIAAIPAVTLPLARPAPGKTADPTATVAATLSPSDSWGSRVHGPVSASPTAAQGPRTAPHPLKIGVTDADIYTERHDFDFVFAEAQHRRAVVSTRRLKEAFWKRKADPARQQGRLVREILGAIALAAGAPPCENPTCAASAAKSPMEVDRKADRLCPECERRVKGGAVRY